MTTAPMILHHFEASPFSEKVRLVFGLKQIAWQSVQVPRILPKPDVVAFTGGYRRTPFLQIGADIYCDTALMCRLVDRLHPAPPLYPKLSSVMQHVLAQWADTDLFWTAVPYTMQPAGAAWVFRDAPPGAAQAFAADRAAMTTGMRRPGPVDSAAQLRTYLGWLETLLSDGRGFLCGAQPSIADFSAVHCIWYVSRVPPVAAILQPFARLRDWLGRVTAFGHGQRTDTDADTALAIAKAAGEADSHAPTAFGAEAGFDPGTTVSVYASDYASDEVTGSLVGLDDDEVVIERVDERAGKVHVHFPRIGFQIRPAAS